ncbi:MAG: helix-turn-helix transcriptional regulator [Actinomycetota bacterium]|nr:helix-turn-helix transcriptional regulator [Actinomycetota bacterium]
MSAVSPSAAPGRCHFELCPPRNFLYPGILLLLVDEPRHGYSMVSLLGRLGFGEVDAPSVYRSLGMLEGDGLIESFEAASTAGPSRRVYILTAEGETALRRWITVIADEREQLGRMLRRYTVARGFTG